MELVLTRIAKRKTYTIGKLYIVEKVDDEYLAGEKQTYFCDTLEPTALELKTTVSKEAVLRSPTKAQKLKPAPTSTAFSRAFASMQETLPTILLVASSLVAIR